MKSSVIGMIAGAFLAVVGLVWGIGGFFLALVLMLIGGAIGLVADGKLNLRAAWDALTGRRSAS